MNIFAHRGLIHEYPENSLTSLQKSVDAGFDIETDLRLTKDNEFILIHDDTTNRLTNVEKKVADISLKEGTNYLYKNSTEKLISFSTFLSTLTSYTYTPKLAVHLKADSQTEIGLKRVAQYWSDFNLFESAFVFDLTLDSAEKLKKINNRIKIALIVSEYKFEPTIYLWNEVQSFPYFDSVWAAEYRDFYTKELISDMKNTKEAVYAMSPDVHKPLNHPLAYEGYEKTWEKLIKWNVDGICTDEPRKLLRILKKGL